MPALETAEHVGKALRARRLLLGVSHEQLLRAAGSGHWSDIRFIERAAQPSLVRVRWYYGWMMDAAQGSDQLRTLPYAQREQWYDTDLDTALWRQVTGRRQPPRWWWGRASRKGKAGAWCYLCETMVYVYDAGRAMSLPARQAVMEHRTRHTVAGIAPARLISERQAS